MVWWMYAVATIHVLACLILIGVVLLQHGKGADLALFAGGSSQTAFGPRGAATLLSRVTTWAAVIFMFTSITLSLGQSKHADSSVIEQLKSAPAPTTSAPAAPAPQTPAPAAPANK